MIARCAGDTLYKTNITKFFMARHRHPDKFPPVCPTVYRTNIMTFYEYHDVKMIERHCDVKAQTSRVSIYAHKSKPAGIVTARV